MNWFLYAWARIEQSRELGLYDFGLGFVNDGFIAKYGHAELDGESQDRVWFRHAGKVDLLGSGRQWLLGGAVNWQEAGAVYRGMLGFFPNEKGKGDFLRLLGRYANRSGDFDASALFMDGCVAPSYLLFDDHDNAVLEARGPGGSRGIVADPTEYRVTPLIDDVRRTRTWGAKLTYKQSGSGERDPEAGAWGVAYPLSILDIGTGEFEAYVGGSAAYRWNGEREFVPGGFVGIGYQMRQGTGVSATVEKTSGLPGVFFVRFALNF